MNKDGDMCVKYFNYRVEFQVRGAGHIHGTLWIDWDELQKKEEEKVQQGKETADEIIDVGKVKMVFKKIKEEVFGSEDTCKTNDFKDEKENLIKFINKFTTCSLKNPSCSHIVKDVNEHAHTRSCKKYGPKCRFGFPRFPCIKTDIAIPADVRYSDPEKASSKLAEARKILKEVKEVLENDEVMEKLQRIRKEDLNTYLEHTNIHQKINN